MSSRLDHMILFLFPLEKEDDERKRREVSCVLTALRTYALVCLVDAAIVLELLWFLPETWGKILVGK